MKRQLMFLWSVIRHGDWDIGIETRATWPEKAYWYCGCEYYDGYHCSIHVGWFYISVNH